MLIITIFWNLFICYIDGIRNGLFMIAVRSISKQFKKVQCEIDQQTRNYIM